MVEVRLVRGVVNVMMGCGGAVVAVWCGFYELFGCEAAGVWGTLGFQMGKLWGRVGCQGKTSHAWKPRVGLGFVGGRSLDWAMGNDVQDNGSYFAVVQIGEAGELKIWTAVVVSERIIKPKLTENYHFNT